MAETKQTPLQRAQARVKELERVEHVKKERARLKGELAKLAPKKKAK